MFRRSVIVAGERKATGVVAWRRRRIVVVMMVAVASALSASLRAATVRGPLGAGRMRMMPPAPQSGVQCHHGQRQ
jgi:hypothetical protein